MSKRYNVSIDVFFVHYEEVEADNEEQAKELALKNVAYGVGEELTVHSIEEIV